MEKVKLFPFKAHFLRHTLLATYNEIASAQNREEIFLSKKAKSKMKRLMESCTADQQERMVKVAKADKADKAGKVAKACKVGNVAKVVKTGKAAKVAKVAKVDKAGNVAKADKIAKAAKRKLKVKGFRPRLSSGK